MDRLRAPAAERSDLRPSGPHLSGTLCNTWVTTWSVCYRETLCWFLKWDRRGLSVATTAVQFPARWGVGVGWVLKIILKHSWEVRNQSGTGSWSWPVRGCLEKAGAQVKGWKVCLFTPDPKTGLISQHRL